MTCARISKSVWDMHAHAGVSAYARACVFMDDFACVCVGVGVAVGVRWCVLCVPPDHQNGFDNGMPSVLLFYFRTRRNSCGRTLKAHMARVTAERVNHVTMYCICSFRITT